MKLYSDKIEASCTLIKKLASDSGGYFCLESCKTLGITPMQVYWLCKKEIVVREAPGIFRLSEALEDELYVLSLRYPQLVFSHETALFLWGVSDQPPFKITVTVPRGFHSLHLLRSCRVKQVKEGFVRQGVEFAKTIAGNEVPVYCIERTLCEMLHSPKDLDKQIFIPAFKRYLATENRSHFKLMQFANIFHVEKQMQLYLEGAL